MQRYPFVAVALGGCQTDADALLLKGVFDLGFWTRFHMALQCQEREPWPGLWTFPELHFLLVGQKSHLCAPGATGVCVHGGH